MLRLLVYWENTPRVSLRLLQVRLDSFCVFSDYVEILSTYSETILCTANNPKFVIYFPRILQIRLDNFLAFSIDA